jgi:CDP-diacylglycerol---glycerol-3-phosphate 3-phosphatidyltransferase
MQTSSTVVSTMLPKSREASKLNIANALTSIRLLLAIWLHYRVWTSWTITWADVFIVSIAGLTDLLDGELARRFRVETTFGKLYDKITDKILIVPFFIFLSFFIFWSTWSHTVLSILVSLTFGGIAITDTLICVVGTILAIYGLRFSSSQDGRIKMVCQCIIGVIFILLFLVRPFGLGITHPISILILAAMLTPTSLYTFKSARGYYRDAAPGLKNLGRMILEYWIQYFGAP